MRLPFDSKLASVAFLVLMVFLPTVDSIIPVIAQPNPITITHYGVTYTFSESGVLVSKDGDQISLKFVGSIASTPFPWDSIVRERLDPLRERVTLTKTVGKSSVSVYFLFYAINPNVKFGIVVWGAGQSAKVAIRFSGIGTFVERGTRIRFGRLFLDWNDALAHRPARVQNDLEFAVDNEIEIDPELGVEEGDATAQLVEWSYIKQTSPSVVGTSTAKVATQQPHQRKTFYANGRSWVFYSDGTDLVYRTSTDDTSWTSATVVRASVSNGIRFSIWFNGTYLHYVYAQASSLYYRRGIPNSDGTITWSAAEQTVSTTNNNCYYPNIAVDSNGHAWIGYLDASTTVTPYVIKDGGDNDGTWGRTPAGFPHQLGTVDTTNWRVSVVPLTSGKVFVIYARDDVVIRAKSWSGSAWESEVTTPSPLHYNASKHSAVAQGDDVHLVFLKSTGYDILYVKYTYSTNSFGTETTLLAGASSDPYPVISRDADTNDLYVFWAHSPTGNHTYVRKYSVWGSVWENTLDWITTNNLYGASFTCFYQKYGGKIGLAYLNGSASPYDIRFATMSYFSPYTNKSATTYSHYWAYSSSNTSFRYDFSCSFPSGSSSRQLNCTFPKGMSIIVLVNLTETNGNNFVDPSNYSVVQHNSTHMKVVIPETTINAKGNSYKLFTSSVSYIYSIAPDYTYNSPSRSLNFYCQLKDHNGNPLSQALWVSIWNSTHELSHVSGTSGATGWWNSSITLPATVGTYNLRANTSGGVSYVTVKVTKISTTFTIADDRINVGSSASISGTAKYTVDGSSVPSGYVKINGTAIAISSGSWSYSPSKSSVGKWNYLLDYANNSGGVTTLDASKNGDVIWDRVELLLNASDHRIDAGSNATVKFPQRRYAYDLASFQGAVTLNDSTTKGTVGKYGFKVASITDSLYGLTAFTTNATYVIFDAINVTSVTYGGFDASGNLRLKPTIKSAYDGATLTGYVDINGTKGASDTWISLTWTAGGKFVVHGVNETAYGLTRAIANKTWQVYLANYKLASPTNATLTAAWSAPSSLLQVVGTSTTVHIKSPAPYMVQIDGVAKAIGDGWSYNESNAVIILTLTSSSANIWYAAPSDGGGGDGGGGGFIAPTEIFLMSHFLGTRKEIRGDKLWVIASYSVDNPVGRPIGAAWLWMSPPSGYEDVAWDAVYEGSRELKAEWVAKEGKVKAQIFNVTYPDDRRVELWIDWTTHSQNPDLVIVNIFGISMPYVNWVALPLALILTVGVLWLTKNPVTIAIVFPMVYGGLTLSKGSEPTLASVWPHGISEGFGSGLASLSGLLSGVWNGIASSSMAFLNSPALVLPFATLKVGECLFLAGLIVLVVVWKGRK